jgi:hypothetical protein
VNHLKNSANKKDGACCLQPFKHRHYNSENETGRNKIIAGFQALSSLKSGAARGFMQKYQTLNFGV